MGDAGNRDIFYASVLVLKLVSNSLQRDFSGALFKQAISACVNRKTLFANRTPFALVSAIAQSANTITSAHATHLQRITQARFIVDQTLIEFPHFGNLPRAKQGNRG